VELATPLRELRAGSQLLIGGDRVVRVSEELAARFRPGDALAAVEATGELLLIPARERQVAGEAVARAERALRALAEVSDARIREFYAAFARRLEDAAIWASIARANADDVAEARAQARPVGRLGVDERMRAGMLEGLRAWQQAPSARGRVLETVQSRELEVELVGAALGVVGFVFEGRPNVLADATGVLLGGNTVVFRIGSAALRTARAILALALEPALAEAGLPDGAVALVDSAAHAAGWALFCDRRLGLAVARGSGPAVAVLGALARQAGVPVSLHGTGGAWLITAESAHARELSEVVYASLDRKVCNTLNVCCLPRTRAAELVPAFLEGLERAGQRLGTRFKLHVAEDGVAHVPAELFRSELAEPLPRSELGREWEWDDTPELALAIVDGVDEAIELFNRHSPQFIACLLSEDAAEHARFYARVNAPFVGDGYTRWVDGQLALGRPELGLANWQHGRLLARGGILTGDGVLSVRTRARTRR